MFQFLCNFLIFPHNPLHSHRVLSILVVAMLLYFLESFILQLFREKLSMFHSFFVKVGVLLWKFYLVIYWVIFQKIFLQFQCIFLSLLIEKKFLILFLFILLVLIFLVLLETSAENRRIFPCFWVFDFYELAFLALFLF